MNYHKTITLKDGRNPKGFRSRTTGWQALVLMRLELNWQAAEQGLVGSETVGLREGS